MRANARIERTEQGLRVVQGANAIVRVTHKRVMVESGKITYGKLQASVLCTEELIAA